MTEQVMIVGSDHPVFYPAGTAVPEIPAAANTNGIWVLRPEELEPMVRPL